MHIYRVKHIEQSTMVDLRARSEKQKCPLTGADATVEYVQDDKSIYQVESKACGRYRINIHFFRQLVGEWEGTISDGEKALLAGAVRELNNQGEKPLVGRNWRELILPRVSPAKTDDEKLFRLVEYVKSESKGDWIDINFVEYPRFYAESESELEGLIDEAEKQNLVSLGYPNSRKLI